MINTEIPGAPALDMYMLVEDEEEAARLWREYAEAVRQAAAGEGTFTGAEREAALKIMETDPPDPDDPPSRDDDEEE